MDKAEEVKKAAWKLDREIWSHVPNTISAEDERSWSQSKAREETRIVLNDLLDSYKSELVKKIEKKKEWLMKESNSDPLTKMAEVDALVEIISLITEEPTTEEKP